MALLIHTQFLTNNLTHIQPVSRRTVAASMEVVTPIALPLTPSIRQLLWLGGIKTRLYRFRTDPRHGASEDCRIRSSRIAYNCPSGVYASLVRGSSAYLLERSRAISAEPCSIAVGTYRVLFCDAPRTRQHPSEAKRPTELPSLGTIPAEVPRYLDTGRR